MSPQPSSSSLPNLVTSCVSSTTDWRVRDTADGLLKRRGIPTRPPLPGSNAGHSSTGQSVHAQKKRREDAFFKFVRSSTSTTMSSRKKGGDDVDTTDNDDDCFNIEQVMEDLVSDHKDIVRSAFDVGAKCCVQKATSNIIEEDDEDDDGNIDDTIKKEDDTSKEEEKHSSTSRHKAFVPDVVADVTQFQELRAASMERAHDNRDMGRRRIAVAKEQEQIERLKKIQQEKDQKKMEKNKLSNQKSKQQAASAVTMKAPSASTVPDKIESSATSSIKMSPTSKNHPAAASSNAAKIMSATTKTSESQKTAGGAMTDKKQATGANTASKPKTTNLSPSKETSGSGGLRKFTRNTLASTSSALEARLNTSRATICTTANIVLGTLTPSVSGVIDMDDKNITDVPQNPNNNNMPGAVVSSEAAAQNDPKTAGAVVNMGAVVVEAEQWAKRIISVAENATRRSQRRMQYRKDNMYYENIKMQNINLVMDDDEDGDGRQSSLALDPPVQNPFAWTMEDEEDGNEKYQQSNAISQPTEISPPSTPSPTSVSSSHVTTIGGLSESWTEMCVPKLLSIFQTGVGHGILHDVQWSTRHGRIANLLESFAQASPSTAPSSNVGRGDSDGTVGHGNYGTHLIITVQPDVDRFMKEFAQPLLNSSRITSSSYGGGGQGARQEKLRALPYRGTKDERRRLRQKFGEATGLSNSTFHVILVSYTDFIQDYIHFCQLPFDLVILDDGISWMKVAHSNPGCNLGKFWDDGIFSQNDHCVGLAGTSYDKSKDWDFDSDDFDEETLKDAWIGLTARHRLATSSKTYVEKGEETDLLPVESLLNFVHPQFFVGIKEQWDRSKASQNYESIGHFQKLLAKSMVVHDPSIEKNQSADATLLKLSLHALRGLIRESDSPTDDPRVPEVVLQEPAPDDNFACDGKLAQSRRHVLKWLGDEESSWLRYELGKANFEPILAAMRASNFFGFVCEEVITASSTTNAGAAGQISGGLAFKPAVRCGKCFGYEPGLRQHLSLYHAPPGTWLCRTCGMDCGTSQARTHHERSCGQPIVGSGDAPKAGGTDGGTKGSKKTPGPAGTVGKKKQKTGGAPKVEERDEDGSIRVPTYRGVWVSTKGEYFLKVDGKRWSNEGKNEIVHFKSADMAAKKYDSILKAKAAGGGKDEYNFDAEGNRIVYEDGAKSAITGVGGNSSNVVAKLSVINIKNLPPDVKPLLRDPRQISRTGGNSKRHVYAYRGVCRQTRKSNDRWQSQISFLGVNHYLGTFESEWDAAAIYAWAHLILYGEEATLQAQKEGEEAAAAYEKEKRDVAAGIIPAPAPKPAKAPKVPKAKQEKPPKEKKKPGPKPKLKPSPQPGPKKVEKKPKDNKVVEKNSPPVETKKSRQIKKRPAPSDKSNTGSNKKSRSNLVDRENINPLLGKSVLKAGALVPLTDYADWSDQELMKQAAIRLVSVTLKLSRCRSCPPE